MRKILFLMLLVPGVLLAQSAQEAVRPANGEVTGRLTPSEVAQVLGTATEYKVSEVADRKAGIVQGAAKIAGKHA